jgi:hypothetical protein
VLLLLLPNPLRNFRRHQPSKDQIQSITSNLRKQLENFTPTKALKIVARQTNAPKKGKKLVGHESTYRCSPLLSLEEELFFVVTRLDEFSRGICVAIHIRDDLVRVGNDFPLLRLPRLKEEFFFSS